MCIYKGVPNVYQDVRLGQPLTRDGHGAFRSGQKQEYPHITRFKTLIKINIFHVQS